MSDYVKNLYELLKSYNVDTNTGRTSQQAKNALEKYGENSLPVKKGINVFQRFLMQMKDVMVLILIAAAIISLIVALVEKTGEYIDSIIIIAIVIVNGVLGVRQEYKAEKALDALKSISSPTARVLRNGEVAQIPSPQVVPGDIMLLEAGDFVPADGRLLEAASFKCDESALTGESVPSEKNPSAKVDEGAPVGDRLNMVYSGCFVTYGRARAIVTATGTNTEIGKVANLLEKDSSEPTPLQRKLSLLGKYLGILALIICAVIFVIGLVQGMDVMTLFMTSVSLAVAAIPEGLTAVVTVVLALGVQRMVKKNAIVRMLPAVETLGSASVICSDKTGTLTQNRMTVVKVWALGAGLSSLSGELAEKPKHLIRLGALCNDGRIVMEDENIKHIGDPTETAIIAAAAVCGMEKSELDKIFPRVAELPFDSNRKLMTTVHKVNGKLISVTKGGYDVLLPLCSNVDGAKAESVNQYMAKDALRVLAVACRELDSLPENPSPEVLEKDLMFVGLIGMIDPPREESRDAVARCAEAGIKTVMITGDHITTAAAIAGQLGIMTEEGQAISGQELAEMEDWELEDNVHKYRVYARVSPEDKIRIVNAWKANGEVVAMTGDGVNDAPALKAADIGCAMGITGTDVAKEAADMVLTDDNFSTIVDAVESGRGIFDNIKKTIQFLLGSNLGEIFVVLFAMLFGWGAPLLAIHLLLVNVITDAFPALALGVEPIDSDVMKRSPVPRDENIFANGFGAIIILQGVMIGVLTLVGYFLGNFVDISAAMPHSHEIGVTMAFLILALSQLVQAYNCRSRKSIFKAGLFTNKTLNKACLGSLAVIILICAIPPLKTVFRISTVSVLHWLIIIALSIAPLPIVEIAKAVANSNKRRR